MKKKLLVRYSNDVSFITSKRLYLDMWVNGFLDCDINEDGVRTLVRKKTGEWQIFRV